MVKKLLKCFMKRNCRRQIRQSRNEKAIRKKDVRLSVQWKGCDSFNS